MSDKNIEIIKHIQQYGHPLSDDKIVSDYNYKPYCTGGYQPKPLQKGVVLMPPNTGSNIITTKSSKITISVDYIESILMDHGSYEHSIDRLDGELIMSNDEIRSAAQAIYDYVMDKIKE